MKSVYIIFLCFLVTVLCLSSHKISTASRTSLPGRRPMRKLSMSSTNNKVVDGDGESETSKFQEIPVVINFSNSKSDLDELVYHIDYHGVTTHPNPTPRHPTP
ncbi:hypothetical protein D8674_037498 [Pyrus ussuriensis x Pyrus communis]|uniref:Uncharacterized protein n=1 Tax=Pyrus ussuriensis x Pyrus communis TaxID=2448454 RepID=A0A5N5H565_9ROSA|nr:hypothetical protein D8674_037498 [Pyrus ussuriensis x Pyrus communis]